MLCSCCFIEQREINRFATQLKLETKMLVPFNNLLYSFLSLPVFQLRRNPECTFSTVPVLLTISCDGACGGVGFASALYCENCIKRNSGDRLVYRLPKIVFGVCFTHHRTNAAKSFWTNV